MSGDGKVYPLAGNQLRAAEPEDNIWLSASAGTGKTQVLSARVLRMLLRRDVEPSDILCLTFTKAGAAEMANRINAVLARWVRMKPGELANELGALGADIGPETQARARTLFASVLDCPGGGLRIDTIHAFSQWLLANFPEEADLTPGARPMEDRERDLLARDVLADVLIEAEHAQDIALLDAIHMLTTRKDPGAVQKWLMRCAGASWMWEGRSAWQRPMRARVCQLIEIPADADEEWAFEGLHPDVFPDDALMAMLPAMQAWSAKTGAETAEFITRWLLLDPTERRDKFRRFFDTVLKKDGEPRKMEKPSKDEPRLPEWQQLVADALAGISERLALLRLADLLTAAYELGGAFARKWEEAKAREGLIDFDDLIRKAADLLENKDTSDWIRYKLDRQFNHILIDEAQDTNSSQWDIVFALIDDFFSGEGAAGNDLRTIFTVGDYKQAIFGFQGTSPENFSRAREKVRRQIEAAKENAEGLRGNRRVPTWRPLDLGQSFRTSNIVLHFVNRAIEVLGHEAFGLDDPPEPHIGAERAGMVTLWNPVLAQLDDDDTAPEDSDERNWLPRHDTVLADKIAEQVRRWVSLEEPFVLEKGDKSRHAQAGDILVLVQKRKELASQIVAKLHEKRVAVAGVDRLRLGDPLVVKDLMAALKFASQPYDDLSLANLLASPLMGWSQDDLLAHVPRDHGVRLWDHLRKSEDPSVAQAVDALRELLRFADFQTPQELLSWLLVGPWQGRKKLIARLGREVNDPIDEFVNAAFAYEVTGTPSLAGFIQWFEAGSSELKRDADSASGQVRVMTVHGSKGLQAPIVILADAAGAPGKTGDLELDERVLGEDTGRVIPLPSLSKDEKAGRVEEAQKQAELAEMQEHWRLMYVALTRAEEALFLGGALGKTESKAGTPHVDSWYTRLEPIFEHEELADDIWGARREWGYRADPLVLEDGGTSEQTVPVLPKWATTPVGPEPKPPRPLAPSSAGEDMGADPPMPLTGDPAAARRGILIHSLLERLPDIAKEQREQAGKAWLDRQAHDLAQDARNEMLKAALLVLEEPAFATLFAPDTLAEVPLTATVNGTVIAGTIDRLLVSESDILVVDYKTTRRPPAAIEAIPKGTLKQMAAYVAALEVIYPGRRVRAGLLYTHAPQLFELSDALLEPHKNALGDTQESYPLTGVE
ncbi:ATP-dependent exonuclease [Erythrobacter sp. YT30]|nr:ATP-dependent exonuclease [Erythrobacter sp. YT30]